MINPTISKLLGGVATSLDETVLPELAPGFARNQLVAAISLIRRAATVDERIGSYLWEDNRDIAAVLSEVAPLAGLGGPPAFDDAAYPTLDELRRRNLALQQQLVVAHDTLRANEDRASQDRASQDRASQDRTSQNMAQARAALRALFERMLARESQINTSRWV